MTAFVSYYRVSTERQGQSGLGLGAQRSAVTFPGIRTIGLFLVRRVPEAVDFSEFFDDE